MKERLRNLRDIAHYAATKSKETVNIEGVTLAFGDASPRMRYVMSRGYEKGDAELAARVLTEGDYVLEAGSAIGFMALYCLKVVGVRGVRMVEANPNLAPAIRDNFRRNGIAAPDIVQAAVSASDGSISFGVNANFWSSSILSRANETRVEVPARTLPTLVAEMASKPTALVMDIEGAEVDIPIEHFTLFEKVVIETHRKLVGEAATAKLLAGLEAAGFRQVARMGGSYAYAK
jgi:FkbM family methyltransferase